MKPKRLASAVSIWFALVCAFASAQAPELALPIPGPLEGGEHGSRYRGPGFAFWVPPRWSVELDDIPAGEGLRGERGTARGPVNGGDAVAEGRIRFEPFPPEAGRRATVKEFEESVRSTLAAGLPVGVQPLVSRCSRAGLAACGDEPEGVSIFFTRQADDGSEQSQRRYFVYGYPRPDGRVQTLVCSHRGPAARGVGAMFLAAAEELATTWPAGGSVFQSEEHGVVLSLPQPWRLGSFMQGAARDCNRSKTSEAPSPLLGCSRFRTIRLWLLVFSRRRGLSCLCAWSSIDQRVR